MHDIMFFEIRDQETLILLRSNRWKFSPSIPRLISFPRILSELQGKVCRQIIRFPNLTRV